MPKVVIYESPKKPISGVVHLSIKDEDVNWFVGEKLRTNKPCGCTMLSHGSEATAFCVALYKFICFNLNRKGILICADYGIGNGNFNMSFSCAYTHIKKVYVGIAKTLKSITSSYQIYDGEIALLGCKAKRPEFNYYVSKLSKSGVTLSTLVDGKTKARLTEALPASKLSVESASPTSKPTSLAEKRQSTDYLLIKTQNSWHAAILADMLVYFKVPCLASPNGVIVYNSSIYNKKKSQFTKANITKYLEAIYQKQAIKDFKSNVLFKLLSSAADIPGVVGTLDSVSGALAKYV